MTTRPAVLLCGPVSWNHIVVLDALPEPRPHMQFARQAYDTVGGTSAGKALHLHELGWDVRLHTLIGADLPGALVSSALSQAGLRPQAHQSDATERHTNLMTEQGARVSLYEAIPRVFTPAQVDAVLLDARLADLAIIDLSEFGAAVLERWSELDDAPPVWVDLHDYDGASAFHEPFLRAADTVFMNADNVPDPWELLASCVARGPKLAVCTLGADGAIALDAAGQRFEVPAVPAEVVDANGAGDAFFAGFVAARANGADVEACLRAGAEQAVVALESAHLHPALNAKF